MAAALKSIAKRSKAAIIAYKIYDNWRVRRRFRAGHIEGSSGSTHLGKPLAESVAYVEAQFADYVRYGELTPGWLAGRRVLELGFGDNVGVALKFLAAGAREAVCLDKFYSPRDDEQHRQIYQSLRDALKTGDERRRFDEAIDLSGGLKINSEKLREVYGLSLEESRELLAGEPFDLVYSRVAVQDIYEPDAAWAAMDRVLAPGGLMLHKIDLTDQGMFSASGLHPLTFLTVGDAVYRRMVFDSGLPNRKMVDYYREKMREFGYDFKLLVTDVVSGARRGDLHPHRERLTHGVEYDDETLSLVREIRPRLQPKYAALTDGDLLIAGIFLVARKS